MEKLPGDYIAGFVDGEGCFALKFQRLVRRERKNQPEYFYWDVEFAIVLRADDGEILERIRETIRCGRISFGKNSQVRYSVNDILDLTEKVVPFFELYSLQAKKRKDFELWREAVSIVRRTQRMSVNRQKGQKGFSKTIWAENDIRRLVEIHKSMKPYKSNCNEWKWLDRAIDSKVQK
jgi:hypothetical protein